MANLIEITHRSFSNKKYFTRYDFLLSHYRPGNILDLGNLGRERDEKAGDPIHAMWNEPMGKKIQGTVAKENTVFGFDLFTPKHPETYPNQKQGDIQNGLPYEDGFFDTIYMGQLIEHLDQLGFVLDEINRVLKPDGVFILDTPNPYSLTELVKYILIRKEHLGEPSHLALFTPASLQSLLGRHGFHIEEYSTKFPAWGKYLPSFLIKGLGTHLVVAARKGAATQPFSE